MSGVEIKIESQSYRVIPSEPVNLADAVKYAEARSNGAFGVIEYEDPRALIVVDTDGSLLIHGISNPEAASLIAEATLLRIGLSEKGLVIESGEVLASFSVGRAVLMDLAARRRMDLRRGGHRHGPHCRRAASIEEPSQWQSTMSCARPV